jgi:hypothetical protein
LGLKEPFKDFLKKYTKEGKYILESETAVANIKQFVAKKKEYDTFFINKKGIKIRTTRAYFLNSNIIDKKQTETALAPNITHFYDSELIRILHSEPYNLNFASIHDAFIISCFDCGKLIHSYGNIFKVKLRFNHRQPITCLI